MSARRFDAIIVGGGPGGSTAAIFLAKAGKSVLLLEKEFFPRFHIGESLLPYNTPIFKEMGVYQDLVDAGFTRKLGAQFFLGNGSKSTCFVFRNGRFTEEPEAFQVERSRFDHLLLKHAAAAGAEVVEGCAVTEVRNTAAGCVVETSGSGSARGQYEASYVIDASGRSNLTGNQEGLRVIHPSLKKVAVFGHFRQVRLDPGEKSGDIIIVRLEEAWFWLIPLSIDKVSIGGVIDQKLLARSGAPPAELFRRLWQGSEPLRDRMARAELLGPMHTTSDFSYHNRRLTGPRLLRVGDAAGFMDPIFSAGVFLAISSGKLAAGTLLECLEGGSEKRLFRSYEKKVNRAMMFYWKLVEHFYTTPFMEVFLEPREVWHLSSAVNAALAGRVDGVWAMRWRMQLFYWIVKLQRAWPLVPRISFEPRTAP